MTRREGGARAVAVLVLAITVTGAAVSVSTSLGQSDWSDDRTRPAIAVGRVGIVALAAAAVALYRWRPSAPPWMLMAALSMVWSGWVVADVFVSAGILAPLIRPLVFVMLVSWPSGRLDRRDAWWIGTYAVAQAVMFSLIPQLFDRNPFDSDHTSPVFLAQAPRLADMSIAFGSAIILPVGAALLVLTTGRRYATLTRAGRRMFGPIVAAGAVFATGDLIVVLSDFVPKFTFTDDGLTLYGGYVRLTLNFLPYVGVPVFAVLAAHRATERVRARDWTIDFGGPRPTLDATVLSLLGDGRARLAYPLRDGEWVDRSGTPVAPSADLAVAATIERDHAVIAQILAEPECIADVDTDLLEIAVASGTGDVEFGRLEALANASARDADAAIAALAVARAQTIERLERDLHDGVQQRLVGLALQASLAARQQIPDDDVAVDLAFGVAASRRDLAGCAAGMLPTLIAQRGLTNSITTLAASASIDMSVDIHYPADVPADTAAAAWFVVAEAVANATKHADAKHLCITGAVLDGRLSVSIADDGCGGALEEGSGLTGLRGRVERSGGVLAVESPPGRGTTVRASFAVPNGAPT